MVKSATSIWDDPANLETLKRLWAEGLSASEIGKVLGVSRSAICGKAHRTKECAARIIPGERRMTRPASKPAPRAPSKPKLIVVGNGAVMEKPDSRRKPWVDPVALLERANAPAGEVRAFTGQVGPKPCLWPIGDPGEAGFHSCGQPAVVGKPYCPGHGQRAVQPRKEADPVKALLRSVRRYA